MSLQQDVRGSDLITDVQSKEKHQHASGGVAPMMSGPAIVDVFKERRVKDLDLGGEEKITMSQNG